MLSFPYYLADIVVKLLNRASRLLLLASRVQMNVHDYSLSIFRGTILVICLFGSHTENIGADLIQLSQFQLAAVPDRNSQLTGFLVNLISHHAVRLPTFAGTWALRHHTLSAVITCQLENETRAVASCSFLLCQLENETQPDQG